MRIAIILSAVLHVALFLIAVAGLPRPEDRLALVAEAIPVEIVDIGLLTNTKVDKPEEKPKPKPAPAKPQPSPPKTQPPPPPPQAKAEPTPAPPVKTPEPPKQVAQAEPEPKPEPKPQPKPEPKKEEPKPPPPKKEEPKKEPSKKVEQPKPEPKKEEPPKEEPKRDFASMLKDVSRLKPETQPTPPAEEPEKTETADAPQSLDASKSDRLSISEEDAVRRAISACWFVDGGARNAENQRVAIRVSMNPDRTVRDARVVESTADRATTERALRAVLNPRCQPLPLPPEQYDRWKTITFNFDPRDML